MTTPFLVSGSAQAALPDNQKEIAAGLLNDHATISPKFFYDALGSVLFEAICVLPEYYLTRTESAIFDRHLNDISHVIPPGGTLIDLGAGNCAKAARLFSHLHPDQYVPIDISETHLNEAVQRLQQRYPHIEMTALGMDFSAAWTLPDQVRPDRRLFFYPGSSIGNFHPDAALAFLKAIRAQCDAQGGILIGADLVKDPAVLNAAYDDNLGVTAAFNLNALRHINLLLGADFNVRQWQHIAFFNSEKSRIEMHLEARENVRVTWSQEHRNFIRGERIHTENSYKYTVPKLLTLLEAAGFGHAHYWTDDANWYGVVHAKAI
jgi:dimethylhistidine N-methyltransferase